MSNISKKKQKENRKLEKQRLEQRATEAQKQRSKHDGKRDSSLASDQNIPTEEERRKNGEITKRSTIRAKKHDDNKKQSVKLKQPAIKHKTKYIWDNDAKRFVAVIAFIVAVIVIGITITISANITNQNNNSISQDTRKTLSLVGMTEESRSLIDSINKFETFGLDDNGHSYAELFDTRITQNDAEELDARGQYPTEGIFAYNPDISTKNLLEQSQSENTGSSGDSDETEK